MPWRLAISWTAMKPMLCRLPAWREPGLPSPTKSSMGAIAVVVVPAHPISSLVEIGSSSAHVGYSRHALGTYSRGRWLWVPACAGTTAETSESESLLLFLLRGGGSGRGGRSTGGRRRAGRRARRRAFGGNAGFRGGGGSGSGFGGRLHLFRIARRRHDGHQRLVEPAGQAHVRRQRDLIEMLRIVDLEARDVDVDRFRDVLGRANHLDGVGDDIDRAAAFH